MKFALALLVVLAGLAMGSSETLTTVDGYNPLQILIDPNLFQIYFDCVMEKGTCTEGGQEIKDGIVEHILTSCADCSQQSISLLTFLVRYMIAFKGAEYEEFEEKYDPNQTLRKLYA